MPPNLYPILFDPDKGGASIVGLPQNGPADPTAMPNGHLEHAPVDSNEPAHRRLARRVPRLFRRGQSPSGAAGIDAVAAEAPIMAGAENGPDAEAEASQEVEKEDPDALTPTAASVNITVLIAMPSSKTIFPSQRRLNGQVSASTLRSPYLRHAASNIPKGVAEEAEEDEVANAEKGKMRRAPSLRSVRTVASTRSVAEARREAFFASQAAAEADDGASKMSAPQPTMRPMPVTHPLDGALGEGEEEELPELVFGTASVPILKRVPHAIASNSFYFQARTTTPTSELVHPTKADLRQLLANAKTAQERKLKADAEQKKEADSKLNASASVVTVGATANGGMGVGADSTRQQHGSDRRSSSQEEGRASVASSGQVAALGLGDVVHRMMQPHRAGEENALRTRTTSPTGDDTTDGGHTAHLARSSFGPSFDINRTGNASGLGLQDDHPLQSQRSIVSLETRHEDRQSQEQQQRQSAEPRRAVLA